VERCDVSFPSSNTHCAAWVYRPEESAGPVPCIVMSHGYSLTRHDGLASYAEALVRSGAAVLVYDHRYFGDSGGRPRQLVSLSAQHRDRQAAIAFARRLDGIDPQRIILWGYSLSGGSAITAAVNAEAVAGVILLCPLVDGLARAKMVLRKTPRTAMWSVGYVLASVVRARTVPVTAKLPAMATMNLPGEADGFTALVSPASPWRNEVRAAAFSATLPLYRPIKHGRELRCPILIQVASRDTTTSTSAARKLAQLAREAELKAYDLNHWEPFDPQNVMHIAADQSAWLQRNIRTAS
jgi:pimeloyl-ACP methyl ester carboxylesterase